MGYGSSLLGSNVTSSYLHIDNLRNDLTTGKYFGAAGTKYVRIRHDDTNGIIDLQATTQYLLLQSSAGLRVYEPLNTDYVEFSHDGVNGFIKSIGAGGDQNLILSAQGNNIRIKDYNTAAYLNLTHNSTDGLIDTSVGQLTLTSATGIIQFGTVALAAYTLKMRDTATGAIRSAVITNGAWAIT